MSETPNETDRLEIIKLRIDFFKHITTLSGAAIVIVLTLTRGMASYGTGGLLAIVSVMFTIAAVISMVGMLTCIHFVDRGSHLRYNVGRVTCDLAGGAFLAAVVSLMVVIFGIPLIPTLIVMGVTWVVSLIIAILYFLRSRKRR
jgi:predicted membrane channel-forming protein YqfA (hemolysin III family)